MKDQSTMILGIIATGIVALVAMIGFLQHTTNTPPPAQPLAQASSPTLGTPKSEAELTALLQTELPSITTVIAAAYPDISTLYNIQTGKLYGQGQWYGTILTYRGPDTDNRDTLRLLLQKKDNQWLIKTTPPQPLLNVADYPDVPKKILQDLNQPAVLPGTETSPQIN